MPGRPPRPARRPAWQHSFPLLVLLAAATTAARLEPPNEEPSRPQRTNDRNAELEPPRTRKPTNESRNQPNRPENRHDRKRTGLTERLNQPANLKRHREPPRRPKAQPPHEPTEAPTPEPPHRKPHIRHAIPQPRQRVFELFFHHWSLKKQFKNLLAGEGQQCWCGRNVHKTLQQ